MIESIVERPANQIEMAQEDAGDAKTERSKQTRGYLIALVQEAESIRALGKCPGSLGLRALFRTSSLHLIWAPFASLSLPRVKPQLAGLWARSQAARSSSVTLMRISFDRLFGAGRAPVPFYSIFRLPGGRKFDLVGARWRLILVWGQRASPIEGLSGLLAVRSARHFGFKVSTE